MTGNGAYSGRAQSPLSVTCALIKFMMIILLGVLLVFYDFVERFDVVYERAPAQDYAQDEEAPDDVKGCAFYDGVGLRRDELE